MKLKIIIPNAVFDRVVKRICEKYGYPYDAWQLKLNGDGSLPDSASEPERVARIKFTEQQISKFLLDIIKEKEVGYASVNVKTQAENAVDTQIKLTVEAEA
jgi:hypothetical protein